jgi:hypothetical protein
LANPSGAPFSGFNKTGAEDSALKHCPFNVADSQAILVVYHFFNPPSSGFHPRGA